jgi:hypothetical protein
LERSILLSEEASQINPLNSSVYHHKEKGCVITTFPFFRMIQTTDGSPNKDITKA